MQQVNLTSFEKINPWVNASSFSSVEKLLTEKYGAPTYKKEKRVVYWKLSKTSVELTHLNPPDIVVPGVLSQVAVNYKPSTTVDY